MNTQALSSLLAAVVTFAIGVAALLRDRRQRTYRTFATFTLSIAFYHLLTFLAAITGAAWVTWASFWPAAFLPTSALRFFRSFLAEPSIGAPLRRPAATYASAVAWCLALVYGAIFSPIHESPWFVVPLGVYVFGGLYRCVLVLYLQYRATVGRVEKKRILYLMVGGFAATTLALADFLPRLGIAFPTVGNVLTILYLYFLSQSLFRYRLLDVNELLGRMLVLGSLVVILTVTYGLLLVWVGGGKQQGLFILNTVVASFVILILFEPVRSLLENVVNRWLLRERGELKRRVDGLRRELMNVLDDRELARRIVTSLEGSRRVTDAAIYLIDSEGGGFDLAGNLGASPVERLDLAARRPFFDRLRGGPILLEQLERELRRLDIQADGEAEAPEREKAVETLDAIARTLAETNASLVVPIMADASGEGGPPGEVLIGLICLRDERLRNAFGIDDLDLFRLLAAQAAITLENSKLYERMKERDRLAALGEMAAGLAHEIRNPLGAIKGAAQLLVGPDGIPASGGGAEVGEFLGIIVDEVNRLNRVVSQFLDYSRPYKGEQVDLDVNELIKRCAQLLEARDAERWGEGAGSVGSTGVPAPNRAAGAGGRVTVALELAADLPHVRGDAEHLQQVFLNLGLNALEAMPDGGRLTIATRRRARGDLQVGQQLEVRFRDTGVGVSREQLGSLFIPFFTTKDKGTGLGLPISQRIVSNHGGTIEVRSESGKGATFSVILPAAPSSEAKAIDEPAVART